MTTVLGIDSSTQSCKAVLVDAESGEVIKEQRAPHPQGTQVDPRAWIEALRSATDGLLERADAVSIAGQQHGMVTLDHESEPVRNAMLWNDTSSAPQASQLIDELGGPLDCARRTGSVFVASITGTKLRWLAENEPENAERVAQVALPHDFLTFELGGRKELTTDHGDASGTGYYNPTSRRFEPELAEQFLKHAVRLPRIAEPNELVGSIGETQIAAGTGDNMAAALGLDLKPGEVCVSLGTSGVASAVVGNPVADASGSINGFCDATGRYLPLACTLNGARVLELGARLLGVDNDEFARMALSAEGQAPVLLPYLDGERTPNRPHATGVLSGLTSATSREQCARSFVEGILFSLKDAVSKLESTTGVPTRRILLIGGGARSAAVRALAPHIFSGEVVVPEAGEYVAIGAARQAAWALSSRDEPPQWQRFQETVLEAEHKHRVSAEAVAQYAELRDLTEPLA
ncbi:xylulokinase [Corynebacterium tapiri]|uniref:Xylulose kinase n=1 Tax=Corynebacterium tapiri TaxID=1448266 RepID=A0A5C4U4F4_9CORY|nr:xylulokinase [Corynebacterium tapiri]TNL98749.1 xylulokinase [Corynebacterium tapiri]